MVKPQLRIGICGTFDVENYGDLLFPLVAEAELKRRLGSVELQRFSYSQKAPPQWPYSVSSISELPDAIATLDGMLIGGGDLIRFDKGVAPGYDPPTSLIHHPTGYWLLPTLLALQHDCPVAWNAPGVHGEVPGWAEQLLRLAIDGSRYVTVRDELSKRILAPYALEPDLPIVPDTCFGLARLLDVVGRSDDLVRLREACGLTRPYIVLQAIPSMQPFCRLVCKHPQYFQDYQFVALEIGRALGDNDAVLREAMPDIIRLPNRPSAILMAELIKESAAVVGTSLHLTITALAFGLPAFRPPAAYGGKYAVLAGFDRVYPFGERQEDDARRFVARLGRVEASPTLNDIMRRLDQHWDRIASVFSNVQGTASSKKLSKFIQLLPGWLEADAQRHRSETEKLRKELMSEHAAGDAQSKIMNDRTSQGIDPRKNRGHRPSIIDWNAIDKQKLETDPFEWAFVNGLFSPIDAKSLADTFPHDNFKTVKGYDGEKGYEYEARALIHMHAHEIHAADGLSDSWRRLAEDLLSPAYRAAMTRLTRRDLMSVPMEAYVCHYGPGAWLGPHLDLKDKILTHVFYFNGTWNNADGGCLDVLRSADMSDVVSEIAPTVGNSSVLIRSDRSWHSVSRVAEGCRHSRRSMNVIFFHPGSVSTMWPPGESAPLHDYETQDNGTLSRFWKRLRGRPRS
jgi:Polysaccharide pyruvyl transferase/2OG-Fe(II) oxygenase superfamily